jgi:membrane dipeptidase
MKTITLEQARQVHSDLLVFDGHNDTPVERVARGEGPFRWLERDTAYDMDVPRMRDGGFDGGFFIVGNGAVANVWVTAQRTLAQIDAHPDVFRLVCHSNDVLAAREAGQISVLITVEGAGRWLEGSVDTLRLLYRLGLRALGITHGEGGPEVGMLQGSRSEFGPCTVAERDTARRDLEGLTDFGRDVLRVSNELGIVTDLSHINDKAFYEVLELSSLPVTMTHTAAFGVCPHWRCMTDDQIRALADAGGVLGIAFAPMFIDAQSPTIERLVDHVAYVADLVGVDHVGIGSDYDGLGRQTKPVVPDVSCLPELTQALLARGFSEEEAGRIWSGNFLRLLRGTIDGPAEAS